MADSQRIEDLRRRVQKDPASIAFAQLAEELRRAEQLDESISICRAGLQIHPGYLSARVTLGRALLELGNFDEALAELQQVLTSAPENLAAIRGVAEIHHKQGNLAAALRDYRSALALARNDPDLQQTVEDLAKQVEPPKPIASEGLSLDDITKQLSLSAPPPPMPQLAAVAPAAVAPAPEPEPPQAVVEPAQAIAEPAPAMAEPAPAMAEPPQAVAEPQPEAEAPKPEQMLASDAPAVANPPINPERERAVHTISVLEQWLDAIHAARAERLA